MSTPFYDLASLVLVPSGTKAQKIYAQKPLTTDGQLAFTRSTTATRVNSAGLIEASAINVPRLDYLNSSCPKLLLEPSRANLILQSSAFDNATWDRNGGSITANAVNSPDGTANADTFTEDTATSTHYEYNATAITATAAAYTGSIFAKAGTRSRLIMGLYDGTSANYQMVQFDLSAGTIVQEASAGIGKIENYGNGWYRCSVTRTLTAMGCYLSFGPHTNTNLASLSVFPSYLGTGGTINLYGAQLELGAYPTSLIPTTTAAVTRGADACSKTGISSLIGQTEGTIFIDFVWRNSLTDVVPFDITGSDGKLIWMRDVGAQFYGNGTTLIADIGRTGAVQGTRYKIAFVYGQNDFRLYRNGSLIGTDTSGTFTGTFSDIALNSVINQANGFNQILLFKTKLTNAQLAELTA